LLRNSLVNVILLAILYKEVKFWLSSVCKEICILLTSSIQFS
jgi:hypothetical protein